MMKSALCLALVALLCGSGLAVDCPGAADPSCNAFASLKIEVTKGTCSGEAGADCEAVSKSQSKFRDAYAEWWGEGKDACEGGKVEAAVTTVATAIAEVWANAASKVTCDGRGFACGWSIAAGNTFGVAFAEALAQAAADAFDGDFANAFCYADIRAVSSALAEAAGAAQSDVCVNDSGTKKDFEKSYVKAISQAISDAFARASASACNKGDAVVAESLCKGFSAAGQGKAVIETGDVCGGTSQLSACSGPGKTMCCAGDFNRNLCSCGEGCKGPWVKKDPTSEGRRVFENSSKQKCFCL